MGASHSRCPRSSTSARRLFPAEAGRFATRVAGELAILFAFFPTTPPSVAIPLTPLQRGLGEHHVDTVHFASASAFGILMAATCYAFGSQEGLRVQASNRHSPGFWRHFHHGCAYLIVGAALPYAVDRIVTHYGASLGRFVDGHALLFAEVASFTTFAISWLCTGSELKTHPVG